MARAIVIFDFQNVVSWKKVFNLICRSVVLFNSAIYGKSVLTGIGGDTTLLTNQSIQNKRIVCVAITFPLHSINFASEFLRCRWLLRLFLQTITTLALITPFQHARSSTGTAKNFIVPPLINYSELPNHYTVTNYNRNKQELQLEKKKKIQSPKLRLFHETGSSNVATTRHQDRN